MGELQRWCRGERRVMVRDCTGEYGEGRGNWSVARFLLDDDFKGALYGVRRADSLTRGAPVTFLYLESSDDVILHHERATNAYTHTKAAAIAFVPVYYRFQSHEEYSDTILF